MRPDGIGNGGVIVDVGLWGFLEVSYRPTAVTPPVEMATQNPTIGAADGERQLVLQSRRLCASRRIDNSALVHLLTITRQLRGAPQNEHGCPTVACGQAYLN